MSDLVARRLIVVTGAAGGIGSAVATKLRDSGYSVLATDRTGDDVLRADISSTGGIRELEAAIENRIERGQILEGLVNVAGVLHSGKLFEKLSVADTVEAHAVGKHDICAPNYTASSTPHDQPARQGPRKQPQYRDRQLQRRTYSALRNGWILRLQGGRNDADSLFFVRTCCPRYPRQRCKPRLHTDRHADRNER